MTHRFADHATPIAVGRLPRRALIAGLVCSAVALGHAGALAQGSWPTGPLKFVVPYPAGGNADNVARMVAAKVQASLGQPVVIDNRGGAGGTIGTDAVAKAAPDGTTFLLAPMAVAVITPHLRKLPYDPLADLMPVAKMSGTFGIVTARKDLPASDMAGFIALAKQSPGKMVFGSAGNATATHISGEIVHMAAGIQLLHVPYKGSALSLNDLLAGRIDVIYDPVGLPQVKAGNLKALAVTSRVRNPALPDVPTLAEQGIDAPVGSWFGVFAPKGTSPAIVARLSEAVGKALQGDEIKSQLTRVSQYPDFEGPKAFEATVRKDHATFKELLGRMNLKL